VVAARVLVADCASAFVTTPVGGRPGDTDVTARVTLERGNVEPHSNQQSWAPAQWQLYAVGATHNFGQAGPLHDWTLALDLTLLDAPAEVNDPSRLVIPPGSQATFQLPCDNGAVRTGALTCQFHRPDTGLYVTPRVFANLVHEGPAALGVYLQGTIPIGIDLNRFVLPRFDPIAVGAILGFALNRWLDFESHSYVAPWGYELLSSSYQNGAVAQTDLLGAHAERWLLPGPIGLKAGFYWEGDLQQRYDERYDAAFTQGYRPGAQDGQGRERIRGLKYGIVAIGSVVVAPRLAIELGTVQKRFGYDAVATQSYFGGARYSF
jgi:hypothetical protein